MACCEWATAPFTSPTRSRIYPTSLGRGTAPARGASLWPTTNRLRPHGGRFHLEPARAPHQVELEIDILRRPVRVGLGPHPGHAVAQPPLQRAEALPFQPVDRIAVGMALRDLGAG